MSEIIELWVLEGFGGILLTIEVSFNPIIKPIIVTVNAAILINTGMVVIGVFSDSVLNAINGPATMLPEARRIIGFIIMGMFSCRYMVKGCLGCPVCTSIVIRSVYTAVNEVAISVRSRAQAFRYDVDMVSMMMSLE